MYQEHKLWPTTIEVFDNFLDNETVYSQLKEEALISKTVAGQSLQELTSAQQFITRLVTAAVINYCANNDIDFDTLKFSNLQKGCLYKYDQSMVCNHLYEPHHDMVEQAYVTALFYVDSSYDGVNWCGGELCMYKELTFAEYPFNTVNILPKPNRLIIFPGFVTHRVKPYFGDKPRTSLVFGWKVKDPTPKPPLII